MKRKLILGLLLSCFAFTINAQAGVSQVFEKIPDMVKFLMRTGDTPVLGSHGIIKDADYFSTMFLGRPVGKFVSGTVTGVEDSIRLVSVGKNHQGEILLNRWVDRGTNSKITLSLHSNLKGAATLKYVSKAVADGVSRTLKKINSRIEKAYEEMAQNHPMPELKRIEGEIFSIFEHNGAKWDTTGNVYEIQIDEMDPALLQELLTNIAKRVSDIKEL